MELFQFSRVGYRKSYRADLWDMERRVMVTKQDIQLRPKATRKKI